MSKEERAGVLRLGLPVDKTEVWCPETVALISRWSKDTDAIFHGLVFSLLSARQVSGWWGLCPPLLEAVVNTAGFIHPQGTFPRLCLCGGSWEAEGETLRWKIA